MGVSVDDATAGRRRPVAADPVKPVGSEGPARGGRREAILDAVTAVLVRQKLAATEMQDVVERSGVAVADVDAEFPDLDDLLARYKPAGQPVRVGGAHHGGRMPAPRTRSASRRERRGRPLGTARLRPCPK